MFKLFETNNSFTKVSFKYDVYTVDGVKIRATECTIAIYKDNIKIKDIATGVAYCNPADNFEKTKGRKLALARAIKSLGIKKEDRKLIWTAYFESIGA